MCDLSRPCPALPCPALPLKLSGTERRWRAALEPPRAPPASASDLVRSLPGGGVALGLCMHCQRRQQPLPIRSSPQRRLWGPTSRPVGRQRQAGLKLNMLGCARGTGEIASFAASQLGAKQRAAGSLTSSVNMPAPTWRQGCPRCGGAAGVLGDTFGLHVHGAGPSWLAWLATLAPAGAQSAVARALPCSSHQRAWNPVNKGCDTGRRGWLLASSSLSPEARDGELSVDSGPGGHV